MKHVKKVLSLIISFSMILGMLIVPIDAKAASKIKLSSSKTTLTVGKTKTLTLKQGTKKLKGVKWKTSNKKVATVSSKGKIKAKKAGSATITATYKQKSYKCKVTVKAKTTKTVTEAPKVDNTTEAKTEATTTKASTTEATTTAASTTESSTPAQEQKTTETRIDPAPTDPEPVTEDVTLYMTPEDGVIRSEGTTVTLKAVPKKFGSGVPSYQWYKDGSAISGATKNTYDAPAAGIYSCEVIYEDSTYKSGTVTVTSTVVAPSTDKVEWTVEEEPFDGRYSYKDEETGKNYILPIQLKREYVSFDPWPTTVAQVEYVIKNCKDPFVIGALYVVALDNYKYTSATDSNCGKLCFDMMDTIALGAGALTETNPSIPQYTLTNAEKQNINAGAYNQVAYKKDGSTLSTHVVRDFAPRTFLKGATPENGYAPNGNVADINDKSKWKITVDQYVYCFDQVACSSDDADPIVASEAKTITVNIVDDKGNETGETETFENWSMPALHKDPTCVTVCPTTYKLETENGSDFTTKEHNFGIRIGLQYSAKKNAWIPCDYIIINNAKHGEVVTPIKKFNAIGIFSTSHYLAPNDDNDDL